jgi:hypothetical protein
VREVEPLSTHLSSDTSVLNIKHEVSESGVRQVEVPHVLEGALIHLAQRIATSRTTPKRIAASRSAGHLVDDPERVLEQVLLSLVLLDGRLYLALDRFPDIVEGRLASGELATVVVESRVDAELIVRTSIPEVETSRNREVSLKSYRQLVQNALTSWRRMCDKYSGFGWIVDSVGRVHQLAHLEKSGPHGSLAASDRCPAFAIVKQLVHNHGTTKTKKTQLDAANLQ